MLVTRIVLLISRSQLMTTTTATVVRSQLAVDIDTQHKEVLVGVESSRGTYDEVKVHIIVGHVFIGRDAC